MGNSRYNYILYLTKQIKGFSFLLILSGIVRALSKLANAAIFVAASCMLASAMSGADLEIQTAGLFMLFLVVSKVTLSYCDTYVSHDMSFKILTRLREKLYSQIDAIAPGGIDGCHTADFATAIVSDINVFEWFYAHVLVEWFGTGITVIILGAVLAQYSVPALLISICCIISALLIPQLTVSKAEEKGLVLKCLFGELNSVIADGVNGIKDIIGYNREKAFYARVDNVTKKYARTQLKYTIRSTTEKRVSQFVITTCIVTSVISTYLFGFNNGRTSLLPVFALVVSITGCVEGTLSESTNYGFVFGAAKRVVEIMELDSPVHDIGTLSASTVCSERNPCRLTFEDVSFNYNRNTHSEVLSHVSFEALPGQTTAIVAASGGGKSTIAKLIQRFWDVDAGKICINGTDIRELRLCELRKLVTLVPQETYLFNASIMENLRMVEPAVSVKEIHQAAMCAQADRFIQELRNGYDTMIGENGTLLSGGEKQRIALAQAFLIGAPLLILDEATSALDAENESRINEMLYDTGGKRTTILIAHRLSSIKSADHIVFLKEGTVQKVGTYLELLNSCPAFCELVQEEVW